MSSEPCEKNFRFLFHDMYGCNFAENVPGSKTEKNEIGMVVVRGNSIAMIECVDKGVCVCVRGGVCMCALHVLKQGHQFTVSSIACSLTSCPLHQTTPSPPPIFSPIFSPFFRVVHSIRLILKPLCIYIWICTYSTRHFFVGGKHGKLLVSKHG